MEQFHEDEDGSVNELSGYVHGVWEGHGHVDETFGRPRITGADFKDAPFALGMSREILGRELAVSAVTIRGWERGRLVPVGIPGELAEIAWERIDVLYSFFGLA